MKDSIVLHLVCHPIANQKSAQQEGCSRSQGGSNGDGYKTPQETEHETSSNRDHTSRNEENTGDNVDQHQEYWAKCTQSLNPVQEINQTLLDLGVKHSQTDNNGGEQYQENGEFEPGEPGPGTDPAQHTTRDGELLCRCFISLSHVDCTTTADVATFHLYRYRWYILVIVLIEIIIRKWTLGTDTERTMPQTRRTSPSFESGVRREKRCRR
mmetsp:Transcript_6059/g.15379  ORF Transcript_6059/g.15379 Transcript_6059/m.15379 type:complete len:211 (-) Transcript_6059:464-1096(-)